MIQLACILAVYVAAALLFGASRDAGQRRWQLLAYGSRALAAQLVACFVLMGVALVWREHEPGPAGVLVVSVGLLSASSVVAVLAGAFPRAVQVSVPCAALVSVVCAAVGRLT